MRIALVVVGVVVTLFGLLWALQGFGVVGGSPMSNTTTWSIIGPIVALIGIVSRSAHCAASPRTLMPGWLVSSSDEPDPEG